MITPIIRYGTQEINECAIPQYLLYLCIMESGDHKYYLPDSQPILVSESSNNYTLLIKNTNHGITILTIYTFNTNTTPEGTVDM